MENWRFTSRLTWWDVFCISFVLTFPLLFMFVLAAVTLLFS